MALLSGFPSPLRTSNFEHPSREGELLGPPTVVWGSKTIQSVGAGTCYKFIRCSNSATESLSLSRVHPELSIRHPNPNALGSCSISSCDAKCLQHFVVTFRDKSSCIQDASRAHVVSHVTSRYEGNKSLATSARLGAGRRISHPPEAEGILKAVPQNVITHIRSCTAGL